MKKNFNLLKGYINHKMELLSHKQKRIFNIVLLTFVFVVLFVFVSKNIFNKKTIKEDGELEKYKEKFLLYKKHINNLQDRTAEIKE